MGSRLSLFLALFTLMTMPGTGQNVSAPKSIELTVYNDNFALVRDQRTLQLDKGNNTVEVEDVAAKIEPSSVLLRSVSDPDSLAILEQNYQYDLITPENILAESVGKNITLTRTTKTGSRYAETGTLLNPPATNTPGGSGTGNGIQGLAVAMGNGTVLLDPNGEISITEMPDGLHPIPTLSWILDSAKKGKQDVEISYLTNGIAWKADYVALVNEDDTALDLNAWVTLDNRSGATYKDARLSLIAGDVRHRQPVYYENLNEPRSTLVFNSRVPEFEEKAFFEYHLYTMQRATTIHDKETKQLSLLNGSNISATKQFIYDPRGRWFQGWWYTGRADYRPGLSPDTSTYHKVNVVIVFKNSRKSGLGIPLPKGRVRVYKLDDEDRQQFVGEDSIDHTPKDESVQLYVGNAFDIVGDYRRTKYHKISTNKFEESYEVKIRNHKKEAVDVGAIEHVWGDWEMLRNTHPFIQKDAHTLKFPLHIEPDGETILTYKIQITN